MTFGLVIANYSLPELQAVKLTFFAPWVTNQSINQFTSLFSIRQSVSHQWNQYNIEVSQLVIGVICYKFRKIYFSGSSSFKMKNSRKPLVLCTRVKVKFKFIKNTLDAYLIDPCPQNSLANRGRKEKWKKKTIRIETVVTITKNRYTNINFRVVCFSRLNYKIISTQRSLALSTFKLLAPWISQMHPTLQLP